MDNEGITSSTLTEELRQKTFEYFKKNKIGMPIEVENSINDVFDENDFIDDDEEAVNIYFKEDLDDFLAATSIFRYLNIQVSGGNSSGDVMDKYTYYGILSNQDAITEIVNLYNGEELVNEVTNIAPSKTNILANPIDFCVVLMIETEFHMGQCSITPRLHIYVPRSGDGI